MRARGSGASLASHLRNGRPLRSRRMGDGVTGSPDMTIMKASDTLTVVEGYDAMRIFLETVRRRRGDAAAQIEPIIGGLKWADGTPVDPTMWEDWLAAGQIACNCRTR